MTLYCSGVYSVWCVSHLKPQHGRVSSRSTASSTLRGSSVNTYRKASTHRKKPKIISWRRQTAESDDPRPQEPGTTSSEIQPPFLQSKQPTRWAALSPAAAHTPSLFSTYQQASLGHFKGALHQKWSLPPLPLLRVLSHWFHLSYFSWGRWGAAQAGLITEVSSCLHTFLSGPEEKEITSAPCKGPVSSELPAHGNVEVPLSGTGTIELFGAFLGLFWFSLDLSWGWGF